MVALLNDLFGIQARGGCACAGPYGHRLLAIDLTRSQAFEREVLRGCEGIKPGWVRVNFNYFISERVFEYIVQAVQLIAEQGWKLLPDYTFDGKTGSWKHGLHEQRDPLRLTDVRYDGGKLEYRSRHATEPESALAGYLQEARRLLDRVRAAEERRCASPAASDFERLRWFPLPAEVQRLTGVR